jgi:hypothetical protein
VVLTETTNTIDFLYSTNSGDPEVTGVNASVGIQGPLGAASQQFACDAGSRIAAGVALRFTPMP